MRKLPKKFQLFEQTKKLCLQERIVRSHLNCFAKKAKKVVANFVFLLLKKEKIFSAIGGKICSKKIFAIGRKGFSPDLNENNCSVSSSVLRNCPFFSHFCVFGWNCFWRTSSKKLLLLATIFSANGGNVLPTNQKRITTNSFELLTTCVQKVLRFRSNDFTKFQPTFLCSFQQRFKAII